MGTDVARRIGILWRGGRDARPLTAQNNRLRPVFDALAARNIIAEPVVFDDEMVEDVRRQLLALDGVLVWVDPITDGHNRSNLDALLREVAATGVWVSAHPDVILKMGTKEILVRTRDLSCGSDTYLYRTLDELRSQFPERLARTGARVLKQYRGNAGIGVWKVEAAATASDGEITVDVQDAHPRDTHVETVPIDEFIQRCAAYLGDGCIVDQPFQPRVVEGMVRCYSVRDEVIGFARQEPDPAQMSSGRVFGLPARKTMFEATEPRYATLRAQMEAEWIPAIQRVAAVEREELPLLWDADFLFGPKDVSGDDTYVLCEINVSAVTPFPDAVPGKLADAVVARLAAVER